MKVCSVLSPPRPHKVPIQYDGSNLSTNSTSPCKDNGLPASCINPYINVPRSPRHRLRKHHGIPQSFQYAGAAPCTRTFWKLLLRPYSVSGSSALSYSRWPTIQASPSAAAINFAEIFPMQSCISLSQLVSSLYQAACAILQRKVRKKAVYVVRWLPAIARRMFRSSRYYT